MRVELGKIESTLSACDGIAETIVVPQGGTNDEVRVTAYIVPEPSLPASVQSTHPA